MISMVAAFFLISCTMFILNCYIADINNAAGLKSKIVQVSAKQNFETVVREALEMLSDEIKEQTLKSNGNESADSTTLYSSFYCFFRNNPLNICKLIYSHEPLQCIEELKNNNLTHSVSLEEIVNDDKEQCTELHLLISVYNKTKLLYDEVNFKIYPLMTDKSSEALIISEKYE